VQLLEAVAKWLAKAEAQRPDGGAEALLAARLAPDMFPLATQIRFACVQAQEGSSACRGGTFRRRCRPSSMKDGTPASGPGTIADAQARIAETLALVREAAAQGVVIDRPRRSPTRCPTA
jgi:hypothetical protein